MRDQCCPICRGESELVLSQHLGAKMALPAEVPVRWCAQDNFLFVAAGAQSDYDAYYAAVANDTVHEEVSEATGLRSAISQRQHAQLHGLLGDFFNKPRKVLDFGCGGAGLLVELALGHAGSSFFGFEPGPAAKTALGKIEALELKNLAMLSLAECRAQAPFDCIMLSHVIEHVLDFGLIELLASLLAEDGVLYVEVPDAECYESHARREFLYYFDRLHVNHFTREALSRLFGRYGFVRFGDIGYAFPYRDGGQYPALGMLFGKGPADSAFRSAPVLPGVERYLKQERARGEQKRASLQSLHGVVVWGAGDNFYRSAQNGGPLDGLQQMVVADLAPRDVDLGERTYRAIAPPEALRMYSWPVVITVSEASRAIQEQIARVDPGREVFFI